MASYETITCTSALDLLDKLSPRNSRFGKCSRYDWVFRGQADSIWDLRPSAFRSADKLLGNIDTPWDEWDNQTQFAIESESISSFVMQADQAGLYLPGDLDKIYDLLHEVHWSDGVTRRDLVFEWPSPGLWPTVALAQHFGIATRFLDWTRSPSVACYFAAVDVMQQNRAGELAVWAFSTPMTQAVAANQWFKRKRVVVATAPYASNPNLRAQEGVHIALAFQNPNMSAPADRDDLGEFLAEINEAVIPAGRPALLKFVLSTGEAPSLLWQLAKEGVSAARLFPGYGGAARAALETRWSRG
jgi:hypothetical protein